MRVLFSLILVMISLGVSAQMLDSMLFAKVNFATEMERASFELRDKETFFDLLPLMVATNPKTNDAQLKFIEQEARKLIEELDTPKLRKKKEKKKIEFIFDHVHENFLSQYDLRADFYDMFYSGNYNCLTASILFGGIFDHFGIQHDLMVVPSHVYVIAYADGEGIYVEGTDPKDGIRDDQGEIMDHMRQFMTWNAQTLFDGDGPSELEIELMVMMGFAQRKTTDLQGLTGLLYYNLGIRAAEREANEEMLSAMSKAALIEDTGLAAETLQEMLMESADQHARKSPEFWQIARNIPLLDTLSHESMTEDFLGLYEETLQELLDERRWSAVDSIYQACAAGPLLPETKQELLHTYALTAYKFYRQHNELPVSTDVLEQALRYFPEDEDLQKAFTFAACMQLNQLKDEDAFYQEALRLESQFPYIKEESFYTDIKAIFHGERVIEFFNENKCGMAEEHLQKFEDLNATLTEPLKDAFIEEVYYSGWRAYQRKVNTDRAYVLLQRGLELVPNGEHLNRVKEY